MLGGITWYASLDNPQLAMAQIQITDVNVQSVDNIEGNAKLEVNFLIKNAGEKTFTVSSIDYELFANGKSLGRGQYSAQDIPLTGRAVFYPKAQVELPNTFKLINTEGISDEFNAIINNQPTKFSAKGMMVVESALSLVEKEFETSQ
jgi:hypothetical protein